MTQLHHRDLLEVVVDCVFPDKANDVADLIESLLTKWGVEDINFFVFELQSEGSFKIRAQAKCSTQINLQAIETGILKGIENRNACGSKTSGVLFISLAKKK